MRTRPFTRRLPALAAVLLAGGLAAGCSSSGGSGSGSSGVIKAVLPPNTGSITAADNAGLKKLTTEWEAAHKGFTVQWLPNTATQISSANAAVESQASGGAAPDLVWEQYGPVTSGGLPAGLLQNIKPYLDKPNPYVPGNTSWLSLFSPSTRAVHDLAEREHRRHPGLQCRDRDVLQQGRVRQGRHHDRAGQLDGVHRRPGQAQGGGVTPFMFADGALCNPSWFERLATSSLLAGQVSQFDVNHAQVTNGLDVAVGIHKGIISMSNPRYAEVWKLLGQLVRYSGSGQSGYDACATPNATTPPLSTQSLLAQGKVGLLWGGSWYIPQLASAGFSTAKFGVFPEPPITTTIELRWPPAPRRSASSAARTATASGASPRSRPITA